MTREELEAIEARAEAATAGPWEARTIRESGHRAETWGRVLLAGFHHIDVDTGRPDEDAAFIAAARTDIPALLAEVRRLRGLPRLETCGQCDDIRGNHHDGEWCVINCKDVVRDAAPPAHCPRRPKEST